MPSWCLARPGGTPASGKRVTTSPSFNTGRKGGVYQPARLDPGMGTGPNSRGQPWTGASLPTMQWPNHTSYIRRASVDSVLGGSFPLLHELSDSLLYVFFRDGALDEGYGELWVGQSRLSQVVDCLLPQPVASCQP